MLYTDIVIELLRSNLFVSFTACYRKKLSVVISIVKIHSTKFIFVIPLLLLTSGKENVLLPFSNSIFSFSIIFFIILFFHFIKMLLKKLFSLCFYWFSIFSFYYSYCLHVLLFILLFIPDIYYFFRFLKLIFIIFFYNLYFLLYFNFDLHYVVFFSFFWFFSLLKIQ